MWRPPLPSVARQREMAERARESRHKMLPLLQWSPPQPLWGHTLSMVGRGVVRAWMVKDDTRRQPWGRAGPRARKERTRGTAGEKKQAAVGV